MSGISGDSAGGVRMDARVKWFNADKGFGFVAPADGSADAFVHVSVLQKAGLAQLPEGAAAVVEILHGPKGPQVTEIISIDIHTPGPSVDKPTDLPSLLGAVKWFAPEKGFGFVAADDGGKDIFVHKSVLRRCGLSLLADGQRVEVVIEPTPKGREAVWIGTL